jgi:galactokinase
VAIEHTRIGDLGRAACARFSTVFGAAPAGAVFAPGRVNLIGEHTDYNEGFVLPAAIDRGVAIAYARRADRRLRAWADAYGETQSTVIDDLAASSRSGWFGYVAGVAWAIREAGHPVHGIDMAIASDLPIGAGLSSSAALEVASARAFAEGSDLPWDGVAMARACQRAEHVFVGVKCGIMDQFASALSQPGAALLLDCRSLAVEHVPIPREAVIAVLDTAAPRTLAASAYNDRRATCEASVARLQRLSPAARSLRDVDRALLESARDLLDPLMWRRAAHVVDENVRPPAMAHALKQGALETAGRLMDASHESLRTLYEVSSRELDLMVEIARRQRGCFGARMTGAGFGGCAVALVGREAAADFAAATEREYRSRSGLHGRTFVVNPAGGVRTLAGAGGAA